MAKSDIRVVTDYPLQVVLKYPFIYYHEKEDEQLSGERANFSGRHKTLGFRIQTD